jgi:2-C-methyl-D-erythritol 4-phosphate cytidylyltransferase
MARGRTKQAPRTAAVIVAAGDSTRMGGAGGARKPRIELGGMPMLERACAAFDRVAAVVEIVIACHPGDQTAIERWCAERASFAKVRAVVPGGASRTDSVRRGVRWCAFDVELIAVHDAARPLVTPETIAAVLALAAREGAALAALPVRDTLKRAEGVEAQPRAVETLERDSLWAAQTPQAFRAREFRALLARAEAEGFAPTDDAALWERYRGPVALAAGSPANFKITTPEDLVLAESVLARAAPPAGRRT